MKKLMLLAVLLLSNIGLVTAQVTTVSGTVTSAEDGYPVVGAYVLVEGTTIGTSTNLDGNFTLPGVPADAKNLIVSFVGMRTVKVPVSKVVNVILQQDAEAIEETMVVAYGVAKKSSFTGAASTVRGEKIQKMQVSNISKSLEGAIAGVQVASSSGSPGDGASIIVRGLGSISSSQSPLIVVDGVPYEGSLNSISTQDIESLTVLKDAAANSMYGARGSNGVIIITTKGSKSGKPRINFDARYGVNTRAVSPYDIITDHGEYYEMAYEAYRNSLVGTYGWAGASDFAAKNLIGKVLKYNSFKGVDDDAIIDPVTGKLNSSARLQKWDDNWNTEGFRKGQRQEYNFNVSGGTDATQAYMSLGYLSEEGIAYGSGFDRISARVKVDQKIGKYVKVGGNIAYANTNQNWFGSAGSNYSNIFMFSQMIAPIYPIWDYDDTGKHILDESGNWAYDFGTTRNRPYASEQNPVAITQLDLDRQTGDNLSSRGYIDVNFLKDFKFTVNVAYDVFNNNETAFSTPVAGDAASVNGRGYRYSTRRGALNVNQLLNWSRNFGKHNVNILLGHESKNDMYKYLMGHMTNFALDGNPDFANATTYQELTSYTSEYALEGYFSKGEYNFADKYYLTASYRRDGSSRFAADNRWGSFWAVGASWRVTEEPWMKNVTAIDALKVKASYGTQGNDNVGYTHNYEDLYVVNRVDGDAAFSKVNRGNPDLTWEKSNNFNVGFEMGLISRINVNFDFFIKETKDMLFYSPLPTSEGSPSGIYRNEMDMKNTGIEFEVNADIIKSEKFRWNVALNATHYKNELTRLPVSKQDPEKFPDGYKSGSYWRKLGGSLYDYYTYEYAGVDPTNGKPQWRKYTDVLDANGNKTGKEEVTLVNTYSEASERQTGKSAIPDLTGGLTTTFEAFGFDLSIATAFQLGGWVWDSYYSSLMSASSIGEGMHKDLLNRWTPNHTDTNIPAVVLGGQSSNIYGDVLLTSASYFNLRNVTLGYTIAPKLLRKINVEKLRVYLTGDNLWLQSSRKGLDPRQSFSGSTGYVYSALSTYSVGLNLTF